MDFITLQMKNYILIIVVLLKGNQVITQMVQDLETDIKESGEKSSRMSQVNADRWDENGADCQGQIPNCQRCLTNAIDKNCPGCGSDETEGEFVEEKCIDCEKGGDEFEDENLLDSAMNSWKCMECEWGYALTMNQHQCTSCSDTIANCTECYSEDEKIVCSLCDQGFYISNETSCLPCDTAIDNCRTCQFEGQNRSDLVCTGCHVGFFFDYYRNCSACNETMPRCTHCSSFEPCQVFGPVQNLTCHNCEENYFVAEDEASCKLDCRNISSHCENCTIAEEDSICLSCSKNAFQDHEGNCHTCGENITECMECTDASLSEGISCSTCQQGFALHPNNRSCTNCSLTPHCLSCVISESSDGTEKNICEVCQEGFSWSEPDGVCLDCSDVAEHCGSCHKDGENRKTCTACVQGFTFVAGKCDEIVCGVPPPPPYRGGYAFSGIRYGDTVTYDCECGYDVVGDQILTCDQSGQWGQAPCCARKMFGLLKVNQNFSRKDLQDDTVMEHLQSMSDADVRDLDLSHNRLTYVPYLTHFKQLDSLQWLKMRENNIQTFSWDDFPAATTVIDLAYNQLNILPVVDKHDLCLTVRNLNLRSNRLVYIENNQIPDSVESLIVWNNSITEISDISHKTNLQYMDLDGNNIKEIPPKLPASLINLDLRSNNITFISDMRYLEKLETLYLQRNKLTTVPNLLPVSLVRLNLYSNNLMFIADLTYLNKLVHLDLKQNMLTTIFHLVPQSLTQLILDSNSLRGFQNLKHLHRLKQLSLANTNSTVPTDDLPQTLRHVSLHGSDLSNWQALGKFTNLTSLSVSANQFLLCPSNLLFQLTSLTIRGHGETQLSNLTFMTNLRQLYLYDFNITYLPSYFPVMIEDLSVRSNITDFSALSLYKDLKVLRISKFSELYIPKIYFSRINIYTVI